MNKSRLAGRTLRVFVKGRRRLLIRWRSTYWRSKPHPWLYASLTPFFGTFQTGPLEIFWSRNRKEA